MKQYRPEIDGLRAIAILPVIFFHAGFLCFRGGFLGVDIFFVISGYLITQGIAQEIHENKFYFTNFWLRRARRILPALICMTFSCIIAGWFIFLPNDFKNLGRSAIALSVFSSNIYFWLKSGYFAPPAATEPLLHTWSLSVEEQFYILFPIFFYFLTCFLIDWRKFFIYLIAILSLSITCYEINSNAIATFFLLPTRAWELLVGSITALCIFNKNIYLPKFYNELTSIIGLILILIALAFYTQNVAFSAWGQLAVCFGTIVIILTNNGKLTFVGHFLSLRLLVYIGLISYSLYLWHWPLLVFYRYIYATQLSTLQTCTVLIISSSIAWISYQWIEIPFRRKILFSCQKLFILTMILLILIIATMGFCIDLKNGFPSRLNPKIFKIYEEAKFKPIPTCSPITISKNVKVCSNAPSNIKPDLVVWGDSHAYMLLPLIEKLSAQYHIKFWLYSCMPVLNVYNVADSKSLNTSQCNISNHNFINAIKEDHIKNILLASFWVQFVEGREVRQEGAGQRDPYYADSTIKSTTPMQARFVFKKHFIPTVNTLVDNGTTVWIMKQVPFYTYWPSNQLLKVLRYGGNTNKIGRPLSECLKREIYVNSIFSVLTSKKVHYIDPDIILCDKSNFCHGTENNHSLYFDFNHLSTYGVMTLSPLFKPLFTSIAYH